MHIYDESTSRRARWRVRINWSRALTFSERQINYIKTNVPDERGVYCVYAKDYSFPYTSLVWPTKRWSPLVYIGSGWLHERLSHHLTYKRNNILAGYLAQYELAYRYDRIVEDDEHDWPKTVEALMLHLFKRKFGKLPPANRRQEKIPPLDLDEFLVDQSWNFSVLARG